MKQVLLSWLLTCTLLCRAIAAFPGDSTWYYLQRPGDLLSKVERRAAGVEARLVRQTNRYLDRAQRQEEKLYRKLYQKDSLQAKETFGDIPARYAALRRQVNDPAAAAATLDRRLRLRYIGGLDSLRTSLRFLEATGGLGQDPALSSQYAAATAQLTQVQARFGQAKQIRQALNDRNHFLQNQLDRYGLSAQLRKYSKQAYYYQQQIEDYKQLLSDRSRLERKALALLQQNEQFAAFFNKHSQLAALFRLPGQSADGEPVLLAGQQARSVLEKEIQQRFGASMQKVEEAATAELQPAADPLSKLKDQFLAKAPSRGEKSNGDASLPDFKPNGQKTKPLWKRLELGSNVQTTRSGYFPVTSDVGLSLGYKFTDHLTAGVGGSYKLGWGEGIRAIHITHQGMSVRSFADVQLKGSFWLTGGAEWNYRDRLEKPDLLPPLRHWQHSALAGVQKKYKRGKTSGNVQLLYDFLWRQQFPQGPPVLFRVGYSLR